MAETVRFLDGHEVLQKQFEKRRKKVDEQRALIANIIQDECGKVLKPDFPYYGGNLCIIIHTDSLDGLHIFPEIKEELEKAHWKVEYSDKAGYFLSIPQW